MTKTTGTAVWTHHYEHGNLWYIALDERAIPPYHRQIHVKAIIDLDSDGRVAGIEIIDTAMPGPPRSAPRSGGERCVTAAALDTPNPDAVTTAGRG